jgi:hypothetical protein
VRIDLAEVVSRYGEGDRSLARIDEALRALGAGVTLAGVAAPVIERVRRSSAPAPTIAKAESRPAPAPAPAPAARARTRNQLDEELDPNEFPQTVPPPAPDADARAADATEEGFELLVEDDDLLLEEDDDDTQVTPEPGRE